MRLAAYGDHLFLDYQTHWFLWEPAWDSFRPVTSVYWDGVSFVIDDRAFCRDPTDEFYGYGSAEMKEICDTLNELETPEHVETLATPAIGPLTWFRDRFVSVCPCTPMDVRSWKQMHRGRYRTCRKAPKSTRTTRRLEKKDL